MKPHLFVLTIALVMSISGCTSQPLRVNLHHTAGTSGPTVAALTKDDCLALGGKVEDDQQCPSGKVCKTLIHNPVNPNAPTEKPRCLEKEQEPPR